MSSGPMQSQSFNTSGGEEKWKMEFRKATNGQETMNLLQFMQCTGCRSRYYGVKLFDTMDIRQKGAISFEEYADFMRLLAYGTSEEIGSFAFKLFDTDGDGVISRAELREGLQASIEESEAVVPVAEVTKLTEVLAQLFTDPETERITREKFIAVLETYPDVLGNFTIGDQRRAAELRQATTASLSTRYEDTMMLKAWRWISDNPKRAFTNVLTILVILACFSWRFTRYAKSCKHADLKYVDPYVNVSREFIKNWVYDNLNITMSDSEAKYMAFSHDMKHHDPIRCSDARKRVLLSWTLPIAKGCGQGMKAIFTLILLPVSRTLMTKLRRTFLKDIFDFDSAIAYHRMLGKIGFALAWSHTLLHVVDVIRWQNKDLFKEWSFAFPKNGLAPFDSSDTDQSTTQGIPDALLRDPSEQPNVGHLIGSWFGVTGIILISTYSIAALFAFDYPKKLSVFQKRRGEKEDNMSTWRKFVLKIGRSLNDFNNFWYTHHLFAVFYLAMLFHPFPHVPDEHDEWDWSDSWVWVLIPILFYSMERIDRAIQSSSQTPVLSLRLLPGKVVELKTAKPEGMRVKAGQYVFVNCYQIAPYEWHPFTLTSAPHDNYLSVHIRSAGDWTNALYNSVREYKSYSGSRSGIIIDEDTMYPYNIRIAGPYGAPAQSYKDFGVVVCIGAGIGVTPFASILSSVLHSIRTTATAKLRKVYFHWSVRSREEASWFKTLLDEISADDTEGILNINIHITSLKEGNDLRVMLLRIAEFEDIDQEQGKSVGNSIVHFGRPDWSTILREIQHDHVEENKIGVFFCGPPSLKRALKAECIRRSRKMSPKFIFRKEIF